MFSPDPSEPSRNRAVTSPIPTSDPTDRPTITPQTDILPRLVGANARTPAPEWVGPLSIGAPA
jgi:hypothetical protein